MSSSATDSSQQAGSNRTYVDNNKSASPLQKISNAITGSLEKGFYKLGKAVGRRPWTTIIFAVLLCGACMTGLIKFQRESRGDKLWVPDSSKAVKDKEWVDERFPAQSGQVSYILQESNVLTTDGLKKMLQIHKDVVNINITYENKKVSWEQICFKKGGICSVASILELWSFNATEIESLTDAKILQEVNTRRNRSLSPYSNIAFNLDRVLGEITYSNGMISGARLLKATYSYRSIKEHDKDSGREVDERAELWEEQFATAMEKYSNVLYLSRTKFREISTDAISADVVLLTSGYLLIFAYVIVMLGKFTRLEIKVWIALGGIVSVGLSIGVSMGLCSAMGLYYGPAHTTLPFLLLGIGVDDLFVIVQSWSNIPAHIHQKKSIEERIGLALKHAGSSITITTFTDLMAFLVGGTTIIPGLRSFCFFAAVGILCDYILQTTFFVAWLAIDARRSDKRRDGCCCCITLPQGYTPNDCGKNSYLQTFFEKIFAKGILKLPTKIFVLLVVAGLLGVNIYGTSQLRQQFEPKWFVPKGTVVRDYFDLNDEEFPEGGSPVSVYIGPIDYFKEQKQLHHLSKALQSETKYLSRHSVDNWYEKYVEWANTTIPEDTDHASLIIKSKVVFYKQLNVFLNTSYGNRFVGDIKWSERRDEIAASRIRAVMKRLTETKDHVKAMDTLRDLVQDAGLSSDPIVYNRLILFAESHKVIAKELYRNVLLAMAVVFLVTLLIIASPVTSVLVSLCVVFTVVDVAGLMYFWDLTIDTVSTVVIIIAVGLSVDYASHVGHTFLVKSGTRVERTVKTFRDIGPAVWNGGFSTFLAILPLATSESHVFTTFFRILFGVVLFGVFHGMVFLPTMLSIIGPSPYQSAQTMESTSKEADVGGQEVENKVTEPVQSYTNEGIENGNGVPPNKNAFVINDLQGTNGGSVSNGKPSIVEMSL